LFGDGITGMSPLKAATISMGISIATQKRQTQIAASGGKTNGVLMIDKNLDAEKREKMRSAYSGLTDGADQGLFVLEGDMKFERIALSPQDMQLLETYRFQVDEIGRIFGIPSVLLNDRNGTTLGSSTRELIEAFYKLGLRPILERIEASIKRHLVPESDWDSIFIEFDFESLLRASQKDRIDAFSRAINSGQMTPNEARAEEGRPPIEGGDNLVLNGGLEPITFFQAPTNQGQQQVPNNE
jgi:HK97 family phage portal protein